VKGCKSILALYSLISSKKKEYSLRGMNLIGKLRIMKI